MKNRMVAVASAVALLVAVAGVSLALDGSTATAVEQEIAAADAGTVLVTVDGPTITVSDVSPTDGWAPEVEIAEGREVEVDFRNGDLRVKVNAELEDGELRIRVRERNGSEELSDTETAIGLDDPTTSTTLPDDDGTTSTTLPDDDDDTTSTTLPDDDDTTSTTLPDDDDDSEEDNSGPGNSDDDPDDETDEPDDD